MSRFYLFFITLHNLNQQNQLFKIVFYFVHLDLDTSSFVNICDIQNLTNFSTQKVLKSFAKFSISQNVIFNFLKVKKPLLSHHLNREK
jgi:hypothetical protein